jgi:hypothetical protein
MSAQYGDRMDRAIEDISRDALRAYLPDDEIPAARRVYGCRASAGDWTAVRSVHRVFRSAPLVDAEIDRDEARRARRRWTHRALRSTLSGSGGLPRDVRMVWALARHDPDGFVRAVATDLGGLRRRRGRATGGVQDG